MRNILVIFFILISVPVFASGVVLNQTEKNYLKMIGTVKFCVDPDWYPFERVNEKGEHEGISADLLRLIAKRTGLKLQLYRTKDWDASLQASKDHKCQILSFLNETPQRDEWLLFTEPHFTDVNVFITREEHSYISNPATLTDETIVFPSGTAMEELVRKQYPNLKIVNTETENEAFMMVSDKKADMTMRSLIMAAYTIKKEGLFNLKISGQLPNFTNKLRIGVIKSEPILVGILNKGINSITNLEREQIINRHISIKAETAVDYALIFKVVIVFSCISIFGFYWSYRLKKLNEKLKKLSQTDILTGLNNRTMLNEYFDAEVERALRYKRPLSVIMLDIDHFKHINDEYGHLVGDDMLKIFAKIALDSIRGCDIIGRWGGEEFMVLCPETASGEAFVVAERILSALREHDFDTKCRCTASAGVAELEPDDSVDTLIQRADTSLYKAKDEGRDRVCIIR